jgi:hypothetical protein
MALAGPASDDAARSRAQDVEREVFPKVRAGGWIGGNDFSPSIWQHSEAYESTLVCPFAIYFAGPSARGSTRCP